MSSALESTSTVKVRSMRLGVALWSVSGEQGRVDVDTCDGCEVARDGCEVLDFAFSETRRSRVDFAECAPGSQTDRTGCSYPKFLTVVVPTGIVLAAMAAPRFPTRQSVIRTTPAIAGCERVAGRSTHARKRRAGRVRSAGRLAPAFSAVTGVRAGPDRTPPDRPERA
jgi:hypothetical protein